MSGEGREGAHGARARHIQGVHLYPPDHLSASTTSNLRITTAAHAVKILGLKKINKYNLIDLHVTQRSFFVKGNGWEVSHFLQDVIFDTVEIINLNP